MEFDDKEPNLTEEQEEIRRLRQRYEYFQRRADAYKDAIDALSATGRFVGVKIKDAVKTILEERGSPVLLKELIKVVMEGGATLGKRDEEKQVYNSIDASLKAGNLKRNSSIGRPNENDLIALPEMEFPKKDKD